MSRPSFMDSKAAFVVLAWNSQDYLQDCLNSVLSLSCEALDVYVVDNGSTDDTPKFLRNLSDRNNGLHVITETENLGTTVSRNKALRLISEDFDYVCILDSDTIVNQEAFETMASILEDQTIGVVGPTMSSSAGMRQLSGRNLPTFGIKIGKALNVGRSTDKEIPSSAIKNGIQDVGYLLSACWFMPRESIERVGLLDEAFFYAPEDVDWCLRCHKVGLRVVRAWNAGIVHEYQRIGRKKILSKANAEHVKGLARYFRKHGYLFRAPDFNNH